jgi:uncharacterized protein (UPF0333 family)
MKQKISVEVIILVTAIVIGIGVTPVLVQQQVAHASGNVGPIVTRQAPVTTSGDNVYIAWWSNRTGNDEVMFKASTDGGKTFGDKINLSNTTNSESQDAQIAASGDHVYVTW